MPKRWIAGRTFVGWPMPAARRGMEASIASSEACLLTHQSGERHEQSREPRNGSAGAGHRADQSEDQVDQVAPVVSVPGQIVLRPKTMRLSLSIISMPAIQTIYFPDSVQSCIAEASNVVRPSVEPVGLTATVRQIPSWSGIPTGPFPFCSTGCFLRASSMPIWLKVRGQP